MVRSCALLLAAVVGFWLLRASRFFLQQCSFFSVVYLKYCHILNLVFFLLSFSLGCPSLSLSPHKHACFVTYDSNGHLVRE